VAGVKYNMSGKTKKRYRYPYNPKPAVPGRHGELSVHIYTCSDGWCWELREDGEIIKRDTNSTMVDGMANARYYYHQQLTPEEQALEMDCHSGNPDHWQEERPEGDFRFGRKAKPRSA